MLSLSFLHPYPHHPLFRASALIQSGWTLSHRHQNRSGSLFPHRKRRASIHSLPHGLLSPSAKARFNTEDASRLYDRKSPPSGTWTCGVILSCLMATLFDPPFSRRSGGRGGGAPGDDGAKSPWGERICDGDGRRRGDGERTYDGGIA